MKTITKILLLLFLALTVRVFILTQIPLIVSSDSPEYLRIAENLPSGHLIGIDAGSLCTYPPMYSIVTALLNIFIGNLDAVALDGAFVGNTYYFIDENNNIWAVTFDANMQISAQSIINSLDANLDIQDMAISQDGQLLYIIVNNNGVTELLVYNLNDNTYSVLASLGNNNFQVAVDEEGDIVVIEEIPGEENSVIHDVNENTGEMDNSTDIDIDVEDVVTGPRI